MSFTDIFDPSAFDASNLDIPTDWASTGFDFSVPSFSFDFPTITPPINIQPSGGGILTDLGNLVHSATAPITQFYTDQAAIERAKGLTAIAKAQTANQVQVAKAGAPSPYFLIAAGVGVLALVLVAKK